MNKVFINSFYWLILYKKANIKVIDTIITAGNNII